MVNTLRDVLAGAGLGLLTGILIGLSASPVVAVVVGAISAAMLPLLGIVEKSTGDKPHAPSASSWRIAGFGFVCATAVVYGVHIRTSDLLSPSISTQISNLTKAGFTPESAREWVAIKNLGTPLGKENAAAADKTSPARGSPGPSSSVLFAGPADDECPAFDPARYKNTNEQLAYLKSRGGQFAAFARNVETQPGAGQSAALNAAKHLFCPE